MTVNVLQMEQAFKERYPTQEQFISASPVFKALQSDFPFDDGGQPGLFWNEAIAMTEEQGVVYSQAGTDADLPTPIPLKMEKAKIVGNKIEMVSTVSLEAALRGEGAEQTMARTVRRAQESQRDTHILRQEWGLLNGGRSVGEVLSVAAGASATQKIVEFTEASWVPALWARAVNAKFDMYDATSEALSPGAVKRNTSSSTAAFTCVEVNFTDRKVTFNASDAADWSAVVATDRVWWHTSYLNESFGMARIALDQTGSIFLAAPESGGPVPTYGIWKGIDKDLAGQPLTMNFILQFCAEVADRSEMDTPLNLRIGPMQYHGLNIELAASRYYDGSYSKTKGTNGFEQIEFYSPNGKIVIKGHKLVKRGEALLTDDTCFSRRGVTDIINTFPDANGGMRLYRLRDTKNQLDYRSYSQNAMFCTKPFRSVLFRNAAVPGGA